ncbi:MAG: hypothetical protein JST65_13385 [Acidobacteria bacterium]|nr:hypothetical protein [Acidobacteriota bacterium]
MNPQGGGGGGGGWKKVTTPSPGVQPGTGPQIRTKPPLPPRPANWKPIVRKAGPQGNAGPKIGTGKTMAAVNKATDPNQTPPTGVQSCPLKKHFVKVKLHFKDDDTPVPTTAAQILQDAAVINGGPLATGELEARELDGGSYSIYFPDIDEAEWEPA